MSRMVFRLFAALVALGAGATLSPRTPLERATAQEFVLRDGDDLQATLDQALPGDVITLQAGSRFAGPFRLRARAGDGWITLRSSEEAELPAVGSRVSPEDAPHMARLESRADT